MDVSINLVLFDQKPTDQKVRELLQLAHSLETTAAGLKAVPMLDLQANAQRIAECKRRAHTYRVIARRFQLLAQQGAVSSFQEIERAVAA